MSLSQPSQVSATTGSDHQESVASAGPCATRQAMTASRTTPTMCVLVIITGPSRNPESSTQVVPVISPLPFSVNHPAKTESLEPLPRGRIAVTPVRTGPTPAGDDASPEIRVVCPTSTPLTSVMAFSDPGTPSKGTPRSRARGLVCAHTKLDSVKQTRKMAMLPTSAFFIEGSPDRVTRISGVRLGPHVFLISHTVMLPGSVRGDFDGESITFVDRRDGLLLTRLGFST